MHHVTKVAGQVPAEEAYRAAVAEMAATLEGSNVEGARAALRSLLGTISVFEDAGKLYGRLGVDPMPLYRRNPAVFGGMVAGGCFDLYSDFPVLVPAVLASISTAG